MRMRTKSHRGFTLIVAMIALTLGTLFVVGAIAFTGTERTAGVLHTRSEKLSACAQAARNLFLSQVRVLQGNIADIQVNQTIDAGTQVFTLSNDHFGTVEIETVHRILDSSVGGGPMNANNRANRLGGNSLMAGYYSVTAMCSEAGGNAQEVEFVVRVGL